MSISTVFPFPFFPSPVAFHRDQFWDRCFSFCTQLVILNLLKYIASLTLLIPVLSDNNEQRLIHCLISGNANLNISDWDRKMNCLTLFPADILARHARLRRRDVDGCDRGPNFWMRCAEVLMLDVCVQSLQHSFMSELVRQVHASLDDRRNTIIIIKTCYLSTPFINLRTILQRCEPCHHYELLNTHPIWHDLIPRCYAQSHYYQWLSVSSLWRELIGVSWSRTRNSDIPFANT